MPRISFTCGIYKIVLKRDGRTYVGSSSKIEQRFAEHKVLLRRGEHHSPYLQRACTKYGLKAFVFEIIEICDIDLLLTREQFYIDLLKPIFNSAKVAGSRRGVKMSPETRTKIGNTLRGKKLSEQVRANMREAQIRRAALLTAEDRARLSATMKQTMSRPEMKERARAHALKNNSDPLIRAKNSASKIGRPGWVPTAVQRQRKSELMKGRLMHPNVHDATGRFVAQPTKD